MSSYFPDKWVVVKVSINNSAPEYRILAGWYGGFAGSNSWKLSSGTTSVDTDEDGCIYHSQVSGSTYICNPGTYGLTGMTSGLVSTWNKEPRTVVEVMPKGFIIPKEEYCV